MLSAIYYVQVAEEALKEVRRGTARCYLITLIIVHEPCRRSCLTAEELGCFYSTGVGLGTRVDI